MRSSLFGFNPSAAAVGIGWIMLGLLPAATGCDLIPHQDPEAPPVTNTPTPAANGNSDPGTPHEDEVCGDGVCSASESSASCPIDCGLPCWNSNLGTRLPVEVRGSTVGASNDFTAATCGDGGSGPDTAYLYTAPLPGVYTITLITTNFDGILDVRQGQMCNGADLSCGVASPGAPGAVVMPMSAGQSIVIIVDGSAGTSGSYVLQISAVSGGGTGSGTGTGTCLGSGCNVTPSPSDCSDGSCTDTGDDGSDDGSDDPGTDCSDGSCDPGDGMGNPDDDGGGDCDDGWCDTGTAGDGSDDGSGASDPGSDTSGSDDGSASDPGSDSSGGISGSDGSGTDGSASDGSDDSGGDDSGDSGDDGSDDDGSRHAQHHPVSASHPIKNNANARQPAKNPSRLLDQEIKEAETPTGANQQPIVTQSVGNQ